MWELAVGTALDNMEIRSLSTLYHVQGTAQRPFSNDHRSLHPTHSPYFPRISSRGETILSDSVCRVNWSTIGSQEIHWLDILLSGSGHTAKLAWGLPTPEQSYGGSTCLESLPTCRHIDRYLGVYHQQSIRYVQSDQEMSGLGDFDFGLVPAKG